MGKIITIVGNSGVGKSTLVEKLSAAGRFISQYEVPRERPFLEKFKYERQKYCLANQVDFQLYWAEQEMFIREGDAVGVQDGGLDFSLHVFTKQFHRKGDLDADGYALIERLHGALRKYLPPPDLRIILSAPLAVITRRMQKRGRVIDIEQSEDLAALQVLIDDWLKMSGNIETIFIDASRDDSTYEMILDELLDDIRTRLKI